MSAPVHLLECHSRCFDRKPRFWIRRGFNEENLGRVIKAILEEYHLCVAIQEDFQIRPRMDDPFYPSIRKRKVEMSDLRISRHSQDKWNVSVIGGGESLMVFSVVPVLDMTDHELLFRHHCMMEYERPWDYHRMWAKEYTVRMEKVW